MTYTPAAMQSDEPGGQRGDDGPSASAGKPLGRFEHLNGMHPETLPVNDRFPTLGRGLWSHVPESDWNDWRWQSRHRIRTLPQLEKMLRLSDEERADIDASLEELARGEIALDEEVRSTFDRYRR